MSDHLSEEEQIEAIKRWWKENWALVVVPAVVIILGYSGWGFYNSSQEQAAQAASDRYELMMSKVNGGESQEAEARDLASQLITEHSNSVYASLASLIVAKLNVDDGDLAGAEQLLQTVVDGASDESIAALAKARLARVLSAQEKFDAALAIVAVPEQEVYASQYAEIRGDIYVAQGNHTAAKMAYEEALTALTQEQAAQRNFIQIKMNGATLGEGKVAAVESENTEGNEE